MNKGEALKLEGTAHIGSPGELSHGGLGRGGPSLQTQQVL